MPANRDKMQSPESDGKVDDDMMKANIQKQKEREHDYFFNVNTMGLRKRTVRARRQQQRKKETKKERNKAQKAGKKGRKKERKKPSKRDRKKDTNKQRKNNQTQKE